ncbi:MAG: YdiU family protein [Prochlorococcaceae cyanobacterium]
MANPLLSLPFEPAVEGLGPDYWDVVEAARFPRTQLRFRNDDLFRQLGLDPAAIADGDVEAAYGRFEARTPLLALRYHGHQFGVYNPQLGDGRGFLYGQLRDRHGQLQDLGTKGSGTTPWSRGGDGRLTLKGGVREIIASEALHRLGVTTSRTLSLIETGEDLWRGDEPSPTRSSVMVRMARTHLRFGTCERLLYLRQPEKLDRLLRHVVRHHDPEVHAAHPVAEGGDGAGTSEPQLLAFYGALVERVARLTAEWMAAGFTHGVLNTDNMSLAGESFDYGPFAFLEQWDPGFTAAYFDHSGLYAYGQQPAISHHNLRLLQEPLAMLLPRAELEARLERFAPAYDSHYRALMLRRLGLIATLPDASAAELSPASESPDPVPATLQLLAAWPVGYGTFFSALAALTAGCGVPEDPEALAPFVAGAPEPPRDRWLAWRDTWWACGRLRDPADITTTLRRWNLPETPVRPMIERIWEAIDQRDDWQPLHDWLAGVRLVDGAG